VQLGVYGGHVIWPELFAVIGESSCVLFDGGTVMKRRTDPLGVKPVPVNVNVVVNCGPEAGLP
jgi:hypothetical protein